MKFWMTMIIVMVAMCAASSVEASFPSLKWQATVVECIDSNDCINATRFDQCITKVACRVMPGAVAGFCHVGRMSCNDKNACTTDYCQDGACQHVEEKFCRPCETNKDCTGKGPYAGDNSAGPGGCMSEHMAYRFDQVCLPSGVCEGPEPSACYQCEENEGFIACQPECQSHYECNDGNPETVDSCSFAYWPDASLNEPELVFQTCLHQAPVVVEECIADAYCNDGKSWTKDFCSFKRCEYLVTAPPWGFDSDGDGVSNYLDTCPDMPDPEQLDTDGDDFGDVCDVCPKNYNPTQKQVEGGNAFDVCGYDFDNDGDCFCEGWSYYGYPTSCEGSVNPNCKLSCYQKFDSDDTDPTVHPPYDEGPCPPPSE